MLSRAFFAAACLALASAKPVCLDVASCSGGTVCCGENWEMTSDYQCTHTNGTTCNACEGECSFEAAFRAKLYDEDDNELPCTEATTTSVTGSSGGSTGVPPTTPSSSTTMVLASHNGMGGWADIPNSRFGGFRDFFLGLTGTVPSFYTKSEYSVVYDCSTSGIPSYLLPPDFAGCNIFFFVYRCPPCESRCGDIGHQLLACEDVMWHAQNCGPTFKLDKDYGADHHFVAYMAELKDGQRHTVKLADRVELMWWGMTGKDVICSTKETAAQCAMAPSSCEWSGDSCRPLACPKSVYQGPSLPKCAVCVDDEPDFLPEVVGVEDA